MKVGGNVPAAEQQHKYVETHGAVNKPRAENVLSERLKVEKAADVLLFTLAAHSHCTTQEVPITGRSLAHCSFINVMQKKHLGMFTSVKLSQQTQWPLFDI